jgi:hypothetical protein
VWTKDSLQPVFCLTVQESSFLFYLNKSRSLAYSIIFRPRRLSAPPPPNPQHHPFHPLLFSLPDSGKYTLCLNQCSFSGPHDSHFIFHYYSYNSLQKVYASRFSQNLYQRCNANSWTHTFFLVVMNIFWDLPFQSAVIF